MKLQSSDPTGSMTASDSGRGLDSSHCSAFTGQRPHLRQGRRQRQAHQLCRGVTGDNVRAKAIAITWEDMAELEEYSPGAWSDTDSAAQTRPDIRPASVLPESRAKPLKINRDLLLVRSKCLTEHTLCVHCRSLELVMQWRVLHLWLITFSCRAVPSKDPQAASVQGLQHHRQVGDAAAG